MNRAIKFRAWDKTENKMHNVLSLALRWSGGYVIETDADSFIKTRNEDESVLLQYTGLKDKKGNEIYEGDLFEYITPISHCKYRKSVQYEVSEACWILWDGNPDNRQSRLASGLASHGEVVGNIFQNTESLKRYK